MTCPMTSTPSSLRQPRAVDSRSARFSSLSSTPQYSTYPSSGPASQRRRLLPRCGSARGVVSLAVIDASVLAVFYVADDPRHALVVERPMLGDALFAPAHLDAEIVSALRGMARSNQGLEQVVPRALTRHALTNGSDRGRSSRIACQLRVQPSRTQNFTLPKLLAELPGWEDKLRQADAIIVGIAHNSIPLNDDEPCGSPFNEATETIEDWSKIDAQCTTAATTKYGPMYDELYSTIAQWRAGKPTILLTLNKYNDWIGFG